jgi:hypothetical protein
MFMRALSSFSAALLLAESQVASSAQPAKAEQPLVASPQNASSLVASSPGTDDYHFTEDGAKVCDFGVTVTETECLTVGSAILTDMKYIAERDYLVAGSFDNAPAGCSFHTQQDYAVTYNTNVKGDNDGNFALICHGAKAEVHGVRLGENACDFGVHIKVDECLAAVNAVLTDTIGHANSGAGASTVTQVILNAGHWKTVPYGCSMHVGAGHDTTNSAGDAIAFFNTMEDAQNDGSYVLVCTGTVVPQR